MICKACGHESSDDSQFCPQCGLPLSVDDSLEEDAGERPVLSGVVPYVIPGQKTGAIPVRDADDADASSSGDEADGLSDGDAFAADGSCEEAGSSRSGLDDEPDSELGPDSKPGLDSDSELESDPELKTESAPADRSDGSDSAEAPARTSGPAGMVSWDREFPTAQITAVMPEIQDPSAASRVPSDGEAGGCVESGVFTEVDDAVDSRSDFDSDAHPGVSDEAEAESEGNADSESVSERAADLPDESGSEASSDTDKNAGRENLQGEGASKASCGGHAKHAGHAQKDSESGHGDHEGKGADAKHVADGEGDSAVGDGDFDADATERIVYGRHVGTVDRSAKTERLDRVSQAAPDSTAVIPSISKKGPQRFSGFHKDKDGIRGRIPAKYLGIALAAIALIVVAVAIKLAFFNVAVPQVVDSPSREARARLDAAGFQVEVVSQVTDDAEDGTVLACDPASGTKHRKGSTVTLTVAASQTIPDVVGMDLDAAREMLEEQGATNVEETVKKSNQPENTVVEVSPGVGEPFSLDEKIVLTVATTAYMPDVVGSTQEEAQQVLSDAGYIAEVKWTESEKDPGTVVSTSPKAKELANIGSKVTITVASPGPSAFLHVMEYFDIDPADLSDYLQWKGYVVGGSFRYTDSWSGKEYVSEKWKRSDGATVSFTPAPYIEDDVLDVADYMGQGTSFQGVRIFLPADSEESLGTDFTTAQVKEYMEACGLDGMSDSCTASDLDFEGQSGKDLGTGDFICAQGTKDGKVWTILITSEGTYIGAGGYECYEDMDPICDYVAVNEIFQR